jgi:nitrogen fixation protein NifU and related proteins
MASPLESLYQQVILDHAREKHGQGLLVGSAEEAEPDQAVQIGQSRQYNPLCGDEVTLRVAISSSSSGRDPERMIDNLSWAGEGCSISQAATSVLHDLVVGHPVKEALEIVASYREMLRSRGEIEPDEAVLGDAVAFAGVGRHANRVKCAILGWTAFEDALLRSGTGSGSTGSDSPGFGSQSSGSEGEIR